jgi:hypothetical protein
MIIKEVHTNARGAWNRRIKLKKTLRQQASNHIEPRREFPAATGGLMRLVYNLARPHLERG